MIKPPCLHPGDTIGLVSPSSSLAGRIPHRLHKGIQTLEQLGFRVKLGAHTTSVTRYTAGSPEQRAEDINQFFADPNIHAVLSCIGGFHTNQILPFLDFSLIQKNPKAVIGYSDITVLLNALYTKCNLVSFYGPAVLTQFGDPFGLMSYTETWFQKALLSHTPLGEITPSPQWTDEVLDWFEQKDCVRPRIMQQNPGWKWLKKGNGEGRLLGGCVSSLLHLRGTEYMPDFASSILFWEISNNGKDLRVGESVQAVDSHLTDLALSNVFENIHGMIIGRPFGYSSQDVEMLEQIILAHTKKYSFPILFGVDIGHTDPIITLPLGIRARLDSEKNLFLILEEATTY
ncbi:MAG: hypothetical protein UU48_C0004G0058 [Candidatus Uhrbacteria bacterium GW2011_GWF2_41_16]|uniref:Peptidase U61 LD-carboxypeptidase A n=1 Tax=Candidatus Uhrbacteria bacterium GW2011_GWF2_41_16 TaxID=1618997 RepID=A0A0G0XN85_9BACT|nr:MAG: peptidase U61 LD-carboxypeptidase A [Candidatus Peregrinibacteria bacterium GW2011_GWC2_39_14]KKR98265.1 MAG: hypothetical protein UU48_C0004G0058 [Candidatus Uhrbacteria bacterium GW2011_GWF2_41_16]HBP00411.1 LD-carboxypeptidase [Candidatus Uhrbacteria bacterium]